MTAPAKPFPRPLANRAATHTNPQATTSGDRPPRRHQPCKRANHQAGRTKPNASPTADHAAQRHNCSRKTDHATSRSRHAQASRDRNAHRPAEEHKRGLTPRRHRPRTRARYQTGGAMPEASPTGLIAKRCSARTGAVTQRAARRAKWAARAKNTASRQASEVGLNCNQHRGTPASSTPTLDSRTVMGVEVFRQAFTALKKTSRTARSACWSASASSAHESYRTR